MNISAIENKVYSIYVMQDGNLEKVYESTLSGGSEMVQLLPGEYVLIARSNIKKAAANTKESNFTMKSSKTILIKI